MKHAPIELRSGLPLLWLNHAWLPLAQAQRAAIPSLAEVRAAESRLDRFAPLLAKLFPELQKTRGIIESPLVRVAALRDELLDSKHGGGNWFVKCDHALAIAGSVKARGGIYEVLCHAEDVASDAGLISASGDVSSLATDEARDLFHGHEIVVGSTGNLGLSIGVMAAALGFRAIVHMSSDAKVWKKRRLRQSGVEVVEHSGDFNAAVAAGREQSRASPHSYFVDDENSLRLLLGYSVAALRLQRQLRVANVVVDAEHPLFVYIPCGVGGAPSGITLGLRHIFGDDVHCFFAEPVASPCMLACLIAGSRQPVSVKEFGLDNRTEADGLAVASASALAAAVASPLVSGIFTATDNDLLVDLYRLERTTQLRVEPSAAAALRGPCWILQSTSGRHYLQKRNVPSRVMANATHILWSTGGALVPAEEYEQFHRRGNQAASGN